MGFLDTFIAKFSKNSSSEISQQKPEEVPEKLEPEDETRLDQLQSMFESMPRPQILESFLEHKRDFNTTVDALLQSNEQEDEAPNADAADENGPFQNSVHPPVVYQLEAATLDAPLRESAEKQERENPTDDDQEIPDQENFVEQNLSTSLEGSVTFEVGESLIMEDEVSAVTSSELDKSCHDPELQQKMEQISKIFEKKRASLLERLSKKEERRKQKATKNYKMSVEETITVREHQKRMQEQIDINKRLEEEKKKAMSWCLSQMGEIQRLNLEKIDLISQQWMQENDSLRSQLRSKELREIKLEGLLLQVKDFLNELSPTSELAESFSKLSNDLQHEFPDNSVSPIKPPRFNENPKKEFKIEEDDIRIVMYQASVSREEAIKALEIHKDVVNAILECTQ